MTEEHKAALARGRQEARAIKRYLATLDARKPGRRASPRTLEKRLQATRDRIEQETDLLRRVDLLQRRLEIEASLEAARSAADLPAREEAFVEFAGSYSTRKGISYEAWREAGVPAAVLRKAGIARSLHG
jgi:hypothetical protein